MRFNSWHFSEMVFVQWSCDRYAAWGYFKSPHLALGAKSSFGPNFRTRLMAVPTTDLWLFLPQIKCRSNIKRKFSHVRFALISEGHEWSATPIPLTVPRRTRRALLASHLAWSFRLHPAVNAMPEVGQCTGWAHSTIAPFSRFQTMQPIPNAGSDLLLKQKWRTFSWNKANRARGAGST